MKRFFIAAMAFLLVLTAAGCSAEQSPSTSPSLTTGTSSGSVPSSESPTLPLSVADYFPLKENVRYAYEGTGNEFASYSAVVQYLADDRIQFKVDNGGTVAARVYEVKDGKLKLLLSKGEVFYRENMLKASDDGDVLLMGPLAVGTSWKRTDGDTSTITAIGADVQTPLGNFKAIEVTTEGKSGKTIDWYAEGIGLVKTSFLVGNDEISSSLKAIEENYTDTQEVAFYFPNINDDKIYYKYVKIDFKTNDVTRIALQKAYIQSAGELAGAVLTTNTKINSLYLNADGMVYVDLSSDFVTEMSAGAGYEAMILQCIANTFGGYYNAERVILTVDNGPYVSGHIDMDPGDYLEVKLQDTIEIK